jgi:protein tyrosine phosphatase (PTP) superfamily phosphohydrolase (DUF442 family)
LRVILTETELTNFSEITEYLYIGVQPAQGHYDQLRDLGVRLVINMRFNRRPAVDPHKEPIETLWLPSFDSPLLPIPISSLLRGAERAVDVISKGGKVYVHCTYGIHRSVAMGSCILIAMGYSISAAMDLIKERRPVADPYVFYIQRRIRRFAAEWDRRHGSPG